MCGMSMVRLAAFLQVPCLTYGMRGMIAASVEVKGPARDLHSGNDGGTLHAPPPGHSALSHLIHCTICEGGPRHQPFLYSRV